VDVLKNLSFETESGEKLAIVGRNCAGKYSMGLACLRILEGREGKILIGNINIAKLGLHELRSVVTIIPQDQAMFSGSLRENVDQEGTKTDADISRLMKTANLDKYSDLDLEVEEGSANLSHHMTYDISKYWLILVSKRPSGPQHSHPLIRFWLNNCLKIKKYKKCVSNFFPS
jgi:ABC-type multidrug transport system fused ATPase/permease subunit